MKMTRTKPKSARKQKTRVTAIRINDNHLVMREYLDNKNAKKQQNKWEKSEKHTAVTTVAFQKKKMSKLKG